MTDKEPKNAVNEQEPEAVGSWGNTLSVGSVANRFVLGAGEPLGFTSLRKQHVAYYMHLEAIELHVCVLACHVVRLLQSGHTVQACHPWAGVRLQAE